MIYYEKGQQNYRAPLHFREPKVWNLCVSFAHRLTSELRFTQQYSLLTSVRVP